MTPFSELSQDEQVQWAGAIGAARMMLRDGLAARRALQEVLLSQQELAYLRAMPGFPDLDPELQCWLSARAVHFQSARMARWHSHESAEAVARERWLQHLLTIGLSGDRTDTTGEQG